MNELCVTTNCKLKLARKLKKLTYPKQSARIHDEDGDDNGDSMAGKRRLWFDYE